MATQARAPSTLKGAIVTAPESGSPDIIAFQYNPATLKRSLQPQMVGGEENDRSEAVRFTGAPVQVISVDIEVDCTDQLANGDQTAEALGSLPQLAALELLVYPSLDQVSQVQSKLAQGVMEVAPLTAPRVLFVWGSKRVLPVRIKSFSITEEIFDRSLRPIRATVALSMRVLNYTDLDSSNKEYDQFKAYQKNLVNMAGTAFSSDPKAETGVPTSAF